MLENSDVDSIEFDENSFVITIYENSFKNTYIECLSIPNSLIKLKEGWYYGIYHLNKIIISQLNNRFMLKEN